MATYTIKIWETQTLYDHYGTTPANRTETYIQGAFNFVPHSVNTFVRDTYPTMFEDDENNLQWDKEQDVLDGISSVDIPCKMGSADYGGIGKYFRDWLKNCVGELGGVDFHVLLTAMEGQGGHTVLNSDSAICVVTGGPYIPDAPTTFTRYQPKSSGTPSSIGIDAIQTVHHELGHALLHDDEDAHHAHKMGAVTKYDGDYYWTTPLGLGGGHYNACGDYFNRGDYLRWDLVWSDCCVGEWEADPS
jgi:hypothetical protein